ncbi:MAG: alpha/beta hydrolase [Candidatus Hodarchaeota archaeon]
MFIWEKTILDSMHAFTEDIWIKNGSCACIVFLHGYTENPHEYHGLGEELATTGADIYIPILPYHDGDYLKLKEGNAMDYYLWGRGIFDELKSHYKKVIAIGKSLGAGIVYFNIIHDVLLDGAILVGPMEYPSRILKFIMFLAKMLKGDTIKTSHSSLKGRKDLDNEYLAWKRKNFPRIPIHIFKDALNHIKKYTDHAGNVTIPFMSVHGINDFLTQVKKTSDFYFDNVNSKVKIALIAKNTGHDVFSSTFRSRILEEIKKFINHVLTGKGLDEPQAKIVIK